MAFKANLGQSMRVLFVVVGLGLVVTPFALDGSGWLKVLLVAVGVVTVAEGLAGY